MTGTVAGSGSIVEQYEAMRHGVGAYPLPRDVVSVRGPDAETYLQGQCSQDVSGLGEGDSREALLLSPQGKVDAYLRVSRHGDEFLLDADSGAGAAIVGRLERFKLRVDVSIEGRDWACAAVRGPSVDAALAGGAALTLPVSWPGLSGVDLLGPGNVSPLTWVGDRAVRCGEDAWEALRIEAGVPVWGREVTEATIPAEVGLVERTVSFTKGCFTGQELVARLDARGTKVARRLCGLVAAGAGAHSLPPIGAAVIADSGEEAGRVTSAAWSPGLDSVVALTVLHRKVTTPATVEVRWESNGEPARLRAEARPLPLVT